jgi:hypothetical protein
MQKGIGSRVAGAIAALVVTGTIASVVIFSQGKDLQGGGRLDGAWNVRVSIINCQTGGVIRTFDSVTQFMKGGTLVDSTSGVAQALKTPGEGIWEHTSDSSYRFKFKSFTFDTANNYTGYTVIQHDATLDSTGDAYESSGTVEVYAPNGTLVATGCASTTATRMSF